MLGTSPCAARSKFAFLSFPTALYLAIWQFIIRINREGDVKADDVGEVKYTAVFGCHICTKYFHM